MIQVDSDIMVRDVDDGDDGACGEIIRNGDGFSICSK